MDPNSTALIWLLLGFLTISWAVGLIWVYKLHSRFVSAFAGLSSKKNLANTFSDYYQKTTAVHDKLTQLQQSYDHLSSISARSIQKTGIVRFNPFKDTGGDQSFVLALLDNHDSGFLMTSIHSRDGTRVYIKPVEYGASKYTLSEEEKAALGAATDPVKTKRKVKENAQK